MADLRIALVVDAENPVVGDLYLKNGNVRMTANLAEEVAQDLYIVLRSFKGEWFLNRTVGMPYWQSLLGVKTPFATVVQIFRRAILGRPGIAKLTQFDATRLPNRKVSITFAAMLIDGTTLLSSDYGPFILGGS